MDSQAEMLKTLRAAGHRVTRQRTSILAVIAENNTHLTGEEILQRVRKRYPYLNKSTVYRSLDWLTRLGLVNQTDCGRGAVEYELHSHPHHHHAVCRDCGRIEAVDHALFIPLEKVMQARYGFQADLDHFAIFGLCRRCRSKTRRTKC